MINFNLASYKSLLDIIASKYSIENFSNARAKVSSSQNLADLCCLRHDVDYCVYSAYTMANLEVEAQCNTSYFFLVDNSSYNIFTKESRAMIYKIAQMGHEIALHFDVSNYAPEQYQRMVSLHAQCLEDISGKNISSVSYHTPGMIGLQNLNLDDKFCGLGNTYSESFNKNFCYASDSLCRFKNPNIFMAIENKEYINLHLLIHPIWWVQEGATMMDKVQANVTSKKHRLLNEYNETLAQYGVNV